MSAVMSALGAFWDATFDPWTVTYGALLASAMLLAWLSSSVTYQKLGFVMLASWVFYNVVVRTVGWHQGMLSSTLFAALADGILATVAAAVSYRSRSYAGLGVVLLFVGEECCHLFADVRGAQGAYVYHALLNLIFALQVLTIGGASVGDICRSLYRPRSPARYPYGPRIVARSE